jgi:putative transposase
VKVEVSVSEVVQVFKEIQEQPGKILEMVRADMPKAVGEYLSEMMRLELTRFLGSPMSAWKRNRIIATAHIHAASL